MSPQFLVRNCWGHGTSSLLDNCKVLSGFQILHFLFDLVGNMHLHFIVKTVTHFELISV